MHSSCRILQDLQTLQDSDRIGVSHKFRMIFLQELRFLQDNTQKIGIDSPEK